jgi:hypothetical protein
MSSPFRVHLSAYPFACSSLGVLDLVPRYIVLSPGGLAGTDRFPPRFGGSPGL